MRTISPTAARRNAAASVRVPKKPPSGSTRISLRLPVPASLRKAISSVGERSVGFIRTTDYLKNGRPGKFRSNFHEFASLVRVKACVQYFLDGGATGKIRLV